MSASTEKRVVAVIGASADRRKFGNKAVRAFVRRGFDVRPVNPSEATIEGLPAYRSVLDIPERVDMVSVYVPAEVGVALLDEIARKGPAEVWINPGAESARLVARARELGLDPIFACSIVGVGEVPD